MIRSEVLKGHLDLLVLAALRSEPAHGYAVVERLSRASEGAFALPEPTVYAALYRLEAAGYLRSKKVVRDGRTRRIYSLTPGGETALAGRRSEWELFSRGMARTLEAIG